MLFFLFTLWTNPLQAGTAETFGLGSEQAALGGSYAVGDFAGFGAQANPAATARRGGPRFQLSWGLMLMDPSFNTIENVVVQNDFTRDTNPVFGSVDVDYRPTAGHMAGLNLQLYPQWGNLSLGLVGFFPLNHLGAFDSGEAFLPEYVLARARTQRPEFYLALGAELMRNLYFGAGLHLAYTLTAKVTTFFQANPAKPSTLRISNSVKSKPIPYAGLLWEGPWQVGLTFRAPAASLEKVEADSALSASAVGTFAQVQFESLSTVLYDPMTAALGLGKKIGAFQIYAQAEYQFWSLYQPPAHEFTDKASSFTLSPSQNPRFDFRNIPVARMGTEFRWGATTLRAGYGFRPSIMSAPPTGPGNLLDPPRHKLGLGAGWEFRRLLGSPIPWRLDVHVSAHILVNQQITKLPGDETGALGASKQKIGAPGYEAGGKILGGGLSLSLVL